VGFTAGIAVIIFASQIKPLLGLNLPQEPGPLLQKLLALWGVRGTVSPSAAAVAAGTILAIVALRRWQPRWPAMLVAVALASVACAVFNLPIATISSQFGGIPSGLPMPHLPAFSLEKLQQVFPAAVSFTLLGAIESLLSAVVADGMTGRQHRSNCELVAQGVANMGAAVFGGFCVTGTIARTATNVRAGAHGPVAGMLHALFILVFMVFAAPLAGYIPLAALAGVLAVVAWNMIETHAIGVLLRSGWGEGVVLAATFFLTIFRDLTEAIVVGLALGSVLFIHRMSRATAVAKLAPPLASNPDHNTPILDPSDNDIVVYRINGALFFGASATIGSVLDNIHDTHRALVIDFSAVPFLDASGAHMIAGLAQKAQRRGTQLWLAGTSAEIRNTLHTHGLRPPLAQHAPTIEAALKHIHQSAA
jgi:SulP family sulfate permease